MKITTYLFLILTLLFSSNSHAQSMLVIGGDSYAVDCYQRSVEAVQFNNAGFRDLETCDKAIFHGGLSRKDLVSTYVNRGIIYVAMGKFDRAAKDYASALELSNDVAEIYLNRGNLWFIAQRFENAIKDYNRAQELKIRQQHILHFNRGMAFEYMGNLDEAEKDYQASLEIVPEWPRAVRKLEGIAEKRLDTSNGS